MKYTFCCTKSECPFLCWYIQKTYSKIYTHRRCFQTMKACVIQPPYSTDYSRSDECFRWEMEALDRCDPSMDLIVMPEASDVPCMASCAEEWAESLRRYNKAILEKAAETAMMRCCLSTPFRRRKRDRKIPPMPTTDTESWWESILSSIRFAARLHARNGIPIIALNMSLLPSWR